MTEPITTYSQALSLTLDSISPLDSETTPLLEAVGRVAAEDILARVDVPSVNVSLKDGYAIRAADIAEASFEKPVRLRLTGSIAAGDSFERELILGAAMRILSGARISRNADAVVAEEYADDDGNSVTVTSDAKPGRNILRRGGDVHVGQVLVTAGERLRPAQVGLVAAGGLSEIPVIRLPRVAIIATGNEVIAPGEKLEEGKLYASNLVTLAAWCTLFGMQVRTCVVRDQIETIQQGLLEAMLASDAIITSGGAWTGEHDLVIRLMDELHWHKVYHKVKMGPGKAVGFGLWRNKPVFCLPGGPPSNQMAFIQLALPGLLKLAGHGQTGLPEMAVKLDQSVEGQSDWTQFVEGKFKNREGEIRFYPHKLTSRLQSMGDADGILEIPEGIAGFQRETPVGVQLLPCVTVAWPM